MAKYIDTERPIRHLQSLYTVVVGLALTVAMTNLIDQNQAIPIHFSVLPYFFSYLATLVPFYHGALRHLDKTYLENPDKNIRPGALMADWGLLFIEGCILLGMAILLQKPISFSFVLIFLLVFDMLWGFFAHLALSKHSKRQKSEVKWSIINFVASVVLIVLLVFLDAIDSTKPIETYRWIMIMTISIGRTIWDYVWCRDFYFQLTNES
jgi:hypothetical protein